MEHILEGERLVPLKCSHVSHYECLYELTELSKLSETVDEDAALPRCTTCDEVAMPNNEELFHELIREKLLSDGSRYQLKGSAVPISSSKSSSSSANTSPTLPQYDLSPPLRGRTQKQNFSNESISDLFKHPHDFQRPWNTDTSASSISATSIDSLQSIKEGEELLPETVVGRKYEPEPPQSTFLAPKPDVKIDTEVDSLISDKVHLVTCAVTVAVPRNVFSVSRYSQSQNDTKLKHELVQNLVASVPQWKGTEVAKFGPLRLDTVYSVSRNGSTWQDLRCILFQNMLVLFKDYRAQVRVSNKVVYKIKGSVALEKHLVAVTLLADGSTLKLSLSSNDLKALWFRTTATTNSGSSTTESIRRWYSAFLDPTMEFPSSEICSSQGASDPINIFPRNPSDVVIAAPLAGFPNNQKYRALKTSIQDFLDRMGYLDRAGLVFYNNQQGNSISMGLAHSTWSHWQDCLKYIRPTGSGDSKNNIQEALEATRILLEKNNFRDHLTHVYLIGDSNCSELDEPNLDSLVDFFIQHNIRIHTFGVSIDQKVDILARISEATGGTYTYTVEWKELERCISGRQKADRMVTHLDAQLKLCFSTGVEVLSFHGQNRTINPDCLRGLHGQIGNSLPRKSFSNSDLSCIRMGNLVAGEHHTVLIQMRVTPGQLQKLKAEANSSSDLLHGLFSCEITYRDFKQPYFLHSSSSMASISYFSADSISSRPPSSIYDVDSLQTPLTNSEPSIYSDILMAGDATPMVLAIQKHNVRVIVRRMELLVVRNLELALFYSSKTKSAEASKILEDVRPVLKGVLASTCTSDADRESPEYLTAKRLAELLDRDLSILANKVKRKIVFDSDVRNYVVQTIGILRNQRACTSRSRVEADYFN